MKVLVEKQDAEYLAEISLEIPVEQANQEYNKAWKRLGQRLNIPGFRRGKAPRSIIEKTVGIERIKQEAMDRLFPHVFADAVSEHQLDIVAPPHIQTLKFDLNDGIALKATVELRPDVALPNIESLQVGYVPFALPADAEEKELGSIVERLTTLEPVIDRASEKTDILNLDFAGFVNGEPIKGGSAKNYRLDLQNNHFIEGFSDQLVGHRISEEFSIHVTFPENYHDPALSNKSAEFKIKINDISRKVVPELSDDVAKKVGPFEDLAGLKTEIGRLLQNSEAEENLIRQQKAIVEFLLQNVQVAIPEAMLNREAKLLIEEVQQRLKGQGTSWEKFLDVQGREATLSNLRDEARQRLKTSLTFGAIAKQEGLFVTEDEFTNMIQQLVIERGLDEKQLMRQLGNNAASAQALSDQILSQKIIQYLMNRTEFSTISAEEAEKASSTDKTSINTDENNSQSVSEVETVVTAIEGEEFDVLENED